MARFFNAGSAGKGAGVRGVLFLLHAPPSARLWFDSRGAAEPQTPLGNFEMPARLPGSIGGAQRRQINVFTDPQTR